MFQQPKDPSAPFAELGSASSNSSGVPTLANVTSESLIGFLGEFPPDTEEQYLPEHMVSESSAEDDMTLGPDPDSIDTSHLSGILTLPSPDNSLPGAFSSQHPTSSGMQVDSSMHPFHNGVIATPMNNASYMNGNGESTFDLPHPTTRVKRSAPGTENGGEPFLNAPPTPYQPSRLNASSSSVTSDSSQSAPKTGSRRKTNTRSSSVSGPLSGSNAPSSEGYYYRSRDKTNYSQAHKGTLPSPPMTPESQKRIRCTWSLEETRMLFDLLKDTTIESFPDAQHIRAHLLRVDPTCNKTLDHVRNKKANLIQKAHSKNVSVAEILISDMNKLEMELLGGSSMASRGSGSVYASAHLAGFYPGSSSVGGSGTSSMDVSSGSVHQMGTRSSASSAGGSQAAAGGSLGASRSSSVSSAAPNLSAQGSSQLGSPLTISLPAAAASSPSPKVASMRPARRRVSKRASATLLSTMNQAATSTAQQLAKVAQQQQQQQQQQNQLFMASSSPRDSSASAANATSTSSSFSPSRSTQTSPTENPNPELGGNSLSVTSAQGHPSSPSSGHVHSRPSLSPSTNSSSTHEPSSHSPLLLGMGIQGSGSSPSSFGPQMIDPYHLTSSSYSGSGSSAAGATASGGTATQTQQLPQPPQPLPNFSPSEFQRWQRWAFEEISKLVAGQNEVRTALRMMPIELGAPPVTVMPTQPLRLPAHSQWISSWNPAPTTTNTSSTSHQTFTSSGIPNTSSSSTHHHDSVDSETESSDETLLDPSRKVAGTQW